MSTSNSKVKKIFVISLLIVVVFSIFVLPSSAEETYTLTGVRLMVSNPDLSSFPLSVEVTGLSFITDGSNLGGYGIPFINNGTRYLGLSPVFVGPTSYTTLTVYTSSSGWVDQNYRLLNFGTGATTSDVNFYNWIINNSEDVTETFDYERGYLIGLEEGINSPEAEDKWYDIGYQEGLDDGIYSSGSSSFGQNLIGDTLSAPFRALNSFILFESPGGVEVSLGMIFTSLIALSLFIAFLKMFAGG